MSSSFAATATWGLLLLASFVGWGSVVERSLFGTTRADVGLRGAWGMAVAIFGGGLFCLFGIASSNLVYAFVASGVVFAVVYRNREAARLDLHWRTNPGSLLCLLLCGVALALQYVHSVGNVHFNPNDDFIAYFPFARQILEQGTLFDPFSTRRVMSFGGQSFLHAMVLAGSPAFRLHLFDQGIALLLAALLVFGSRKHGHPFWPVLLGLLLLVTLPDIRANTYTQMTGVVAFFGLYRTMVWLDEHDNERRVFPSATLVALTAASTCTLRSNYIAVAVPLVALSYVYRFWQVRGTRAHTAREASLAAVLSFCFLVPWMVMSYQSSRTPLFPLIAGNFNSQFAMLQVTGNWREQLSSLFETIWQNRLLRPFPLLFLAGALFPDRGSRRPLHLLILATILGWALLVRTLAVDVASFERYVYGFLVASVLAVLARCIVAETGQRQRIAQALALLAMALQLLSVGGDSLLDHELYARTGGVVARIPINAPDTTPQGQKHHQLQMMVPDGARMLVMVDYPFLFDFSRNHIFNVDTGAAVSPPPGFPYFQGSEAVARYLRGQSIRYLAFTEPDRAIALFRRDVWERQAHESNPLWRAQAPVYLDIFDNVAALSRTRQHLYDDGVLVLLDLEQRQE